jgi:ArsR family transcriptional regulator, arsenate/arsenite/antimonite-responsive transcriptional repressor
MLPAVEKRRGIEMSQSEMNNDIYARAQFFKALAHPVRLLILNLVKIKPRHGEELAAILNLNPATVSHHLSILSEAGLLQTQKDQYYQVYSLVDQALQKSLSEVVHLPQPGMSGEVKEDAFRDKVLNTFFVHGRLKQFPAQLKKRQVVLEHIVREFEPQRSYTEQEVNRILVDFHEDVASLRRGLIELGLMERSKGIYSRVMK